MPLGNVDRRHLVRYLALEEVLASTVHRNCIQNTPSLFVCHSGTSIAGTSCGILHSKKYLPLQGIATAYVIAFKTRRVSSCARKKAPTQRTQMRSSRRTKNASTNKQMKRALVFLKNLGCTFDIIFIDLSGTCFDTVESLNTLSKRLPSHKKEKGDRGSLEKVVI